jgi:hypothetical protein
MRIYAFVLTPVTSSATFIPSLPCQNNISANIHILLRHLVTHSNYYGEPTSGRDPGVKTKSGSGNKSHRLYFLGDFRNCPLPEIARDNTLQT